ncbi:DUF3172 domain-containing protein [Waterburya agarophytonicola K14]|uniref:DUF3172 domain-containing protein n=1 Tax=Waterburya agarophytonicola KI4 TaxID=2874699 RepID=A0A964BS19_9CYAN|nr:DUF3172 domain-containing protein [Waterburya agarophytonicola]MCC0178668.1 DUF3172 domain-containing protein [Waterburya agarophytonicola KI4]
MARRNRNNGNYRNNRERGGDRYDSPNNYQSNTNPPGKKSPLDVAKIAILGSVFVVGIVIGLSLNLSSGSGGNNSVDSSLQIDRAAPNPEVCQQFGASAIVTDMRVFLTLNPFSVYLTQPRMQPGCVLRRTNWTLLEQKNLVSSEQVRDCKRRMNTFGFVGVLEGKPKIDCVYQNDAAGNLFLNKNGNPTVPLPESDNF